MTTTTEHTDTELEPTATPAPDTDPTDATEDPTVTDDTQGDKAQSNTSREAAKYRTQLRATETERDTLKGQLNAMRLAEIARGAKAAKVSADAVQAAGHTPDTLLDEDGALDEEKMQAAFEDTASRFGRIIAKLPSAHGQGNVGIAIMPEDTKTTWGNALKGTNK